MREIGQDHVHAGRRTAGQTRSQRHTRHALQKQRQVEHRELSRHRCYVRIYRQNDGPVFGQHVGQIKLVNVPKS